MVMIQVIICSYGVLLLYWNICYWKSPNIDTFN